MIMLVKLVVRCFKFNERFRTLIVLVALMFYQNWKIALFALIMMPLAAIVAKSLGKD